MTLSYSLPLVTYLRRKKILSSRYLCERRTKAVPWIVLHSDQQATLLIVLLNENLTERKNEKFLGKVGVKIENPSEGFCLIEIIR